MPAGRDIPQLSAHLGVLPTLIDLCQLETLPGGRFDGVSLKPLLMEQGGEFPERTLFVHNQRVDNPIKGKECAVMTSRWRLIDGRELYDINKDGEQRRDISADYPEIVQDLRREYERWWEDISGRFAAHV